MKIAKNMKEQKVKEYNIIENEDYSDLVAEPQYELFLILEKTSAKKKVR